jgi:hypothetical protein
VVDAELACGQLDVEATELLEDAEDLGGRVVGDVRGGRGRGGGLRRGTPADGRRGGGEDLAERLDGPGDAAEQEARDVLERAAAPRGGAHDRGRRCGESPDGCGRSSGMTQSTSGTRSWKRRETREQRPSALTSPMRLKTSSSTASGSRSNWSSASSPHAHSSSFSRASISEPTPSSGAAAQIGIRGAGAGRGDSLLLIVGTAQLCSATPASVRGSRLVREGVDEVSAAGRWESSSHLK